MKFTTVFGHRPATRRNEPWDGWIIPKCRIGLEWEFEEAALLHNEVLTNSSPLITPQRDGSLRDNGIELVTTGDVS